MTPSEWGLGGAALLQAPRTRDLTGPHYPQTSRPTNSDPDLRGSSAPPPDDGLSQHRQGSAAPDTNATAAHQHRDSNTARLPQQGPGFTRQTTPCDPKDQPAGLSKCPSFRRLELTPALHCPGAQPPRRQGSCSAEVHDRRPGPTHAPRRRLEPQPQCALCGRTGVQAGPFQTSPCSGRGALSPTQLHIASRLAPGTV